MSPKVLLIGTLDTKGQEYLFLKEILENNGLDVMVMDLGVKGDALFTPDISRDEVAQAAGSSIKELIEKDDRGQAVETMIRGGQDLIKSLAEQEAFDGVIALGGTNGTTIGSSLMRLLPVGFPKIMVSTVASGNTRPYIGEKDITMMNSVVDISGVNAISRPILTNAALAMAGMLTGKKIEKHESKPTIAASMMGVTTQCVESAKEFLEEKGFEVIVFHASGSGGRAMEELISSRRFVGVLDITLSELGNELIGGDFSAGPERLTAAAKLGIPQVVAPGALDFVVFSNKPGLEKQYPDRFFYPHNPTIKMMRTTEEENYRLGKEIARKLNESHSGKTTVFLPLGGVSSLDVPDKPFYGSQEDKALFKGITEHIEKSVNVVEMNEDINDLNFALAMAQALYEKLIEEKGFNAAGNNQ